MTEYKREKGCLISFVIRFFIRSINVTWIVFIIGYLILKGQFALITIFGSAPVLLFIIIPLALVFFHLIIDRKTRYIFFSIVGLLLGSSQLYPNINKLDAMQPSDDNHVSVKIMNWNTEMWDMGKDSSEFFNFLVEQNSDIYILQERIYNANYDIGVRDSSHFSIPHPITTVVPGFADSYMSVEDTSELEERFPNYYFVANHQFLVISKYPIVESWLDRSEQYQVVDIDIDGLPFRIFNVHMLLHVELENPLKRKFYEGLSNRFDARVVGFNNLESDIMKTDIEYVVAGDFNSTPNMGTMDELFSSHKNIFRYTDEYFPSTIKFLGASFWQIDYVFLKKNSYFNIKSFTNESAEHLSDHKMQLFELWLGEDSDLFASKKQLASM